MSAGISGGSGNASRRTGEWAPGFYRILVSAGTRKEEGKEEELVWGGREGGGGF